MLRPTSQRPLLAYFDAIKALRLRQLSLILKAGYDPNLMLNGRGQNGIQFMVQYFASSEAHMMRLELPAARSAYLNMAKLMLDAGLDPNAIDLLTGESVIYDAIKLHDRDLVGLLLHYVDLSLRNKDGETALMCAARFGNKQTLRLIMAHLHELELDEFYLRQRNRFGFTALDLARAENLENAKFLAKHLITLGHPAGALLTRSSSHHQLNLARQLSLTRRPLGAASTSVATHRQRLAAAGYADPLLSSDCDSVVDYATTSATAAASQHHAVARGMRTTMGYDSRAAADFNRFLMGRNNEQLGFGSSSGAMHGHGNSWSAQHQASYATTDEDDEAANSDLGFGGGNQLIGGASGAAGAMTRSRSSCNLGPSSSSASNIEAKANKLAEGTSSGKYGQNTSGSHSKKSKLVG